jgi:hypothetical protein
MTESSSGAETQSRYIALISALTEALRDLGKLEAPSEATDHMLEVIRHCRSDYNSPFAPLVPLSISDPV